MATSGVASKQVSVIQYFQIIPSELKLVVHVCVWCVCAVCGCVCLCVCAHTHARACVHASVYVCCERVYV